MPKRLFRPAPPLVFGIYPGGPAGTVGPGAPVVPQDPLKGLAALKLLKSTNRPLVLHLYTDYTSASSAAQTQVGAEIASYTSEGFSVELVLRYRPAARNPATDVPDFVNFVRQTVDQLGPNPGLVALQVTNEANVGGAPNASDGDYPGASDALIQGVIAAKRESAARGMGHLKVGFNWAYRTGAPERQFWSYLARHGGRRFVASLDWVGLDAYPGTWGPELAVGRSLDAAVKHATIQALRALRLHYMRIAAIPRRVPIRFSETGYPTGPGRTDSMQREFMAATVRTVNRNRGKYNVSDYRWFALRDASSGSFSFEDHYGLMTDAYVPKPAFALFRELIASL